MSSTLLTGTQDVPVIRILVVDDSTFFQRALTRLVTKIPGVEVVGTAATGRECLAKIAELKPDVVTLDLEMPDMAGLETLRHLQLNPRGPRNLRQGPHVIIVSAHGGERKTVEALCLGAEDFLVKPMGGDLEALSQQLREKIPNFAPRRPGTRTPLQTGRSGLEPALPDKAVVGSISKTIDIVALCVSTGGPNALAEVLPRFPKDFGARVLVVQHMPPVFTAQLARSLDQKCHVEVCEARDGEVVEKGKVYIAPGSFHMELGGNLTRPTIDLHQGPTENGCRPAADPLLRSLARKFPHRSLAVIMTGMGKDGFLGTQALITAGGSAIAQDRESSVVWGMPRFVTEAGLVNGVYSLDQLGAEIVRIVQAKEGG